MEGNIEFELKRDKVKEEILSERVRERERMTVNLNDYEIGRRDDSKVSNIQRNFEYSKEIVMSLAAVARVRERERERERE
jgi:hypothetical protein